jgi:hypothetical protein
VAPLFVMEPTWIHVDGVPHTVRHFHGLWTVRSLIGSTLDVYLVSLRSQGTVHVLVGMRDLSTLAKDVDDDNSPCLDVMATLKLNGYRLRYRREPTQYVPDPRFRPFFWKATGDDDSHDGSGEDRLFDPSLSTPQDGAMDVDAAQPHVGGGSSSVAPVV